jgi:hypothetical protein
MIDTDREPDSPHMAKKLAPLLFLFLAVLGLWLATRSVIPPITPTPKQQSAPVPKVTSEDRFIPQAPPAKVVVEAAPTVPSQPARANPSMTPNSPAAFPSQTVVGFSEVAGASQVDRIQLMLRDYRTLFGQNPVGSNAEIMKEIMGGNPKQARLGPPEGVNVNGAGELVDQWGTPYFFHQLSGTHMEIRSAGPDKIMWTADDVVSK